MTEDRKHLSTSAWGAVLQVHAAVVPVLDELLMAEVGMPLRFYDVLLELASAPERKLRMSDLADRVVLSRTRVSRLVEEMAAGGLLRARAEPAGRQVGVRSIDTTRASALPPGRADLPRRNRRALRPAAVGPRSQGPSSRAPTVLSGTPGSR